MLEIIALHDWKHATITMRCSSGHAFYGETPWGLFWWDYSVCFKREHRYNELKAALTFLFRLFRVSHCIISEKIFFFSLFNLSFCCCLLKCTSPHVMDRVKNHKLLFKMSLEWSAACTRLSKLVEGKDK